MSPRALPHRRVGRLTLCVAVLVLTASSSALRGDAARAEVERRGEKAALLQVATTYLKALNNGEGDNFGYSVAVSGDTAVIGAPQEDGSGAGVNPAPDNDAANAGAAYVFVRNAGTWSFQAYLKASNPGAGDEFGSSVSIFADTVIVGAPSEDGSGTGVNPLANDEATDSGAAYVFVRNGSTWGQQAYLKASNAQSFLRFGSATASSGNTIIIGAPYDFPGYYGGAYVFVRNGTAWTQQGYLQASNPEINGAFGQAVTVFGDTAIVGAPFEDSSGTGIDPAPNKEAPEAGAAYVFVRNGTAWSQQAYLKASNGEAGDLFGWSVSLSGDTLVVGAVSEDGGGTGVNPPSNEDAMSAGAAYVFIRKGSVWSQDAYLKSSAPGPLGVGWSVAVAGNSVVVGGSLDSPAFKFVRAAGEWNASADLLPSNPAGAFGLSVSMSGNTIVVGAPYEAGTGSGVNPPVNYFSYFSGAAYTFDAPGAPPLVHLDNDTTGDIFLYASETGAWSRQISQAGGTLTQQNQGAWSAGWSVLAATLNEDSLTDFFLFNKTTGEWAKTLAGPAEFTTQSSGSWWPGWHRYVMDLNGDGISDVFLYDISSGQWFKCLSTPTGFTYVQGGWSPGWQLYPMTLNDDALGDLFLFNASTGQWYWALGENGGGFSYPQSGAWYSGWKFNTGDFNGDQLTDLLLYDPPTGMYFVATTSAAGFSFSQGFWSPGWTPHAADLNGDERDDVFLHNEITGVWFQMLSDGAGGFTNAGGQAWSTGWTLYPTDVNGDGRADFLLYNSSTGAWYLARNVANGVFTYITGNWSPALTIVRASGG